MGRPSRYVDRTGVMTSPAVRVAGKPPDRHRLPAAYAALASRPARSSRSFGVASSKPAHGVAMTTAEQQRSDLVESEVFDWRFSELTRAGYAHADAWMLAAAKDVDLRA